MNWAAVHCLHDKREIEGFLRRDPLLHIYELGDLDPFFWSHTTWYGLRSPNGIDAVALIYSGLALPTLLVVAPDAPNPMAGAAELLAGLEALLPRRFYAHLSPGLGPSLGQGWRKTPHGRHLKMGLGPDPAALARIESIDIGGTEPLGTDDLEALQALYRRSYPDNWFDPRMLETRAYVGARQNGRLVCAGGVHVYAPEHGVAALGNVTTDPAFRGQGLATTVTAAVCRGLRRRVEYIGLNVSADNQPAIRCYERLGFEVIAQYDEMMFEVVPEA